MKKNKSKQRLPRTFLFSLLLLFYFVDVTRLLAQRAKPDSIHPKRSGWTGYPFIASHVLAVQGYMNVINGEPPFYMLSLLGGQYLMRGYYEGRYRDKNMLAVQMEYRLPRWKRIGATGFVAPATSNFALKNLKPSAGLGLRYLLVPVEKINLRLDLGWGKDSSGFYLAMAEAF